MDIFQQPGDWQLRPSRDLIGLYSGKDKSEVGEKCKPNEVDVAEVWREYYHLKSQRIKEYKEQIHAPYLAGLERLDFDPDKFPSVKTLRCALAPVRWDIAVVPGFIPSRDYASYMVAGIFPIAATVRSGKHMQHSPVPDAIHDIWGHLPLLFDQDYRDFLNRIAKAMFTAKAEEHELAIFNARNSLGLLEAFERNSIEAIDAARRELTFLEAAERRSPSLFTKLSRFFWGWITA